MHFYCVGNPETLETDKMFDKFFDCMNTHSFTEHFEDRKPDERSPIVIPDLIRVDMN